MDDPEYDTDLEEAIRLSLMSSEVPQEELGSDSQPDNKPSRRNKAPEVIVIDDDDDDVDCGVVKSQKQLSKATSEIGGLHRDKSIIVDDQNSKDKDNTSTSSLLGLNRAAMERERLARRKRNLAEDDTITIASKAVKTNREASPLKEISLAASSSKPKSSLAFPTGVVRKTFIQNSPRSSDDITIEEIFQKNTLKRAILSSFQWDFMWVFDKLNVGQTQIVLVVQAKEEEQKAEYIKNFSHVPRTHLVFPNMGGQVNCMHSKLQMLFYETYLRIAVPTANLVPYDWGESGGIMENSVFIIDLPKRIDITSNCLETDFMKELLRFCRAKGFPDDVINEVSRKYDFSATQNIGFVHSIGGGHVGEPALRTGICSLAKAARSLQLKTKKPLKIDYVTSSLGSLNKEFLLTVYRAAQGNDGWKRLKGKSRPKKSSAKKATINDDDETTETESSEDEEDDCVWQNVTDSFRIYFPSKQTVGATKGGVNCGGTICFQERWFNNPSFPRDLLRDCQSTRPRMLMHNKMLFVRPSKLLAEKYIGWAYVGSANLSESAWGRVTFDRSTKGPKINCRNWECGVVIPVPASSEKNHSTNMTIPQVFGRSVPVPMATESPRLLNNSNPPWYFNSMMQFK